MLPESGSCVEDTGDGNPIDLIVGMIFLPDFFTWCTVVFHFLCLSLLIILLFKILILFSYHYLFISSPHS